jgi:hypothetical protein
MKFSNIIFLLIQFIYHFDCLSNPPTWSYNADIQAGKTNIFKIKNIFRY